MGGERERERERERVLWVAHVNRHIRYTHVLVGPVARAAVILLSLTFETF